MDPLAGTPWSTPETVSGFATSPPNSTLMAYAEAIRQAMPSPRAVDIGCGAGRNAVPLSRAGWTVIGTDLSWPMLTAAATRRRREAAGGHLHMVLAGMERLPLRDRSVDLVIAHGIWNLASSTAQFRQAVADAARVARPCAALFVFTFSRHTLPADARPVPGEAFVFTEFSGQPQCFLTEDELRGELGRAGFEADPAVPLRELNRPAAGSLLSRPGPVIYEAAFRRRVIA